MEPIRCLLVDDERLARSLLKGRVAAYPEFTIVAEAGDIGQAYQAVRRHHPEVIFLDIQMPGGDGFQLLQELMPEPPAVVFITAYDRYALRAFEVNALDYLLKPIEPARFEMAIRRLLRQIRQPEAERPPAAPLPPLLPGDTLLIQAGQSGCFVRLDQVLYIVSEGNYTHLMTVDGRNLVVRQTLENWKTRLSTAGFLPIDRSHILNLQRISKTEFTSRNAIVHFDAPVPGLELGRRAARRLQQALQHP